MRVITMQTEGSRREPLIKSVRYDYRIYLEQFHLHEHKMACIYKFLSFCSDILKKMKKKNCSIVVIYASTSYD